MSKKDRDFEKHKEFFRLMVKNAPESSCIIQYKRLLLSENYNDLAQILADNLPFFMQNVLPDEDTRIIETIFTEEELSEVGIFVAGNHKFENKDFSLLDNCFASASVTDKSFIRLFNCSCAIVTCESGSCVYIEVHGDSSLICKAKRGSLVIIKKSGGAVVTRVIEDGASVEEGDL